MEELGPDEILGSPLVQALFAQSKREAAYAEQALKEMDAAEAERAKVARGRRIQSRLAQIIATLYDFEIVTSYEEIDGPYGKSKQVTIHWIDDRFEDAIGA
jgi:hypothetical protein